MSCQDEITYYVADNWVKPPQDPHAYSPATLAHEVANLLRERGVEVPDRFDWTDDGKYEPAAGPGGESAHADAERRR
jgi:hypothetical protein